MIKKIFLLSIRRRLFINLSLMMLTVLGAMSTSAVAQTCSPNLTFKDTNTLLYANYSNALSRTVSGTIGGSVKNGALNTLSFTVRPQSVNTVNNINVFAGSYNANSNSVRPIYSCSETAYSVLIIIRNVHTRVEYISTGVSSIGLGTITYVVDKRGGAGRLSIQYVHQSFTRPADKNTRLFNGSLLTDAVPLSGGRLTILNQR